MGEYPKWWVLLKVFHLSNMAMFGIYVKFLVGTTLASKKEKQQESPIPSGKAYDLTPLCCYKLAHTTLRSHTLNDLGLDIRLRGVCWDVDVGLPAIELGEAIAIAMIKFQSVMTCDIFSTH